MIENNDFDIYLDADDRNAENLLLDQDITAYVEGLEDELFWEDIFRKFAPNLKIIFYPYSQDNQLKTGKQEVLKNLRNTCQTVILCVDSDLDYLLKNEPIFSHPYVFHTYTYSIENYKIFPYNLNIIVKKCSLPLQQDFCFVKFFQEYSKVVYPLFLYILYFEQKKYNSLRQGENIEAENLVSLKNLIQVFQIDQSQIDLSNNGTNLIQNLQQKVNDLKSKLIKKYGNIDLQFIDDELKEYFKINSETIYWYFNGHILHDNVVKILLKKVIEIYQKERKKFYQDKINNNLSNNQQIENKKKEYNNQFIKEGMNWQTLLKDGHNSCLIYLDQCLQMQKIEARIKEYMLNFSQ